MVKKWNSCTGWYEESFKNRLKKKNRANRLCLAAGEQIKYSCIPFSPVLQDFLKYHIYSMEAPS